MHLIVCVDDRDGMSFCGRPLSRDRELNAHMLRMTEGKKLWMSPNSAALFPEGTVCSHQDFLAKAGAGEYCFTETILPDPTVCLESVTLYHWNRAYPSTVRFPRSLLEGMRLVHTEEFPGNSHETITLERFEP